VLKFKWLEGMKSTREKKFKNFATPLPYPNLNKLQLTKQGKGV
jgi:hypothetical protein